MYNQSSCSFLINMLFKKAKVKLVENYNFKIFSCTAFNELCFL